MLLNITQSQAMLIMNLIRNFAEQRNQSQKDVLDAAGLILGIIDAFVTDPTQQTTATEQTTAQQPPHSDTAAMRIYSVGELQCCDDLDVEFLRTHGYKVTRDYQLSLNLVSPPTYCTHGIPFAVECLACQEDQNNSANVVADAYDTAFAAALAATKTPGDPIAESISDALKSLGEAENSTHE